MNRWDVHGWEALVVGFGPLAGILVVEIFGRRARANRRKARRSRRAERAFVRRTRAW